MASEHDERLKKLGEEVPPASTPGANYVPFVTGGGLLYLAGQIPRRGDRIDWKGRIGETLTTEEGYKAARSCALNLIVQIREACGGSLARVVRIVKLTGFVNCTADYPDVPKVINGASDAFVEVFGDAGRHARSAVGLASLPRGVSVEVEAIVEIAPEQHWKR
ncbi:MAG: RidA family protein [Parvibaculaceae bacterium]